MKNLKPATILFTLVFSMGISSFTGMLSAADNPNQFNRLFVPPKERVTSIKDDGIHDPTVPGLKLLQEPKDAFAPLATSTGGNHVNWVEAKNKGQINPRYDHLDASKESLPLDMSIVIEVKGSMPNVSFPHKQHTEILECANCHDAIFKPLKGGNPMSMAEIMLGQKCGVCHGSVAFPVTECRRCHTESKSMAKSK
ncbi:c(7)-type cytochrome triheme domain-containing protein [Kaarinaea lacus]